MEGQGLLFDASSLIHALKLRRPDLLYNGYVQWLTLYEAINALWEEVRLIKRISADEALKLTAVLRDVLGLVKILEVRGLEDEILRCALKHGLTAYDASYVVLAEKHGLTLVTEDRALRKVASKLIKVVSLEELLH